MKPEYQSISNKETMSQPVAWTSIGEYGKPISKADADAMFKKAGDLKRKFVPLLIKALENAEQEDPQITPEDKKDALGYYTDPGDGFVFSYEIIEQLFRKMNGNPDSYLVLFEAARPQDDSAAPVHKGRRTVVAMAYNKGADGKLHLDTTPIKLKDGSVVNQDDIGTEHPGTKPPGTPIDMEDIPETIDEVITML